MLFIYNRPIEKRKLADVQQAVQRAEEYAAEHHVPLTAERLAAELEMDVTLLRKIILGQYTPRTPRARAVVSALQAAGREATASVTEHAMTRGSSPNMHMLYLKNYAGYGEEAGKADAPTVRFTGEEELV